MSTVGAPTPPPLLPLPHLPLPPRALSLPHTLTPDPHTPSPRALARLRTSTPSIQRRARLLAPPAHFAFVAPCPLPFPYRVAPPAESASEAGGGAGAGGEGEGEGEGGGMAHVERWLAAREALAERPCAPCAPCAPGTVPAGDAPPPLRTLYPAPTPERAGPRVLLALAPACVRDCLPRLDVGDAWEVLGASGLAGGEEGGEGEGGGSVAEKEAVAEERERARRAAVRAELVDVLAGHAVLVDPGLEEEAAGSDLDGERGRRAGWAPWALRYSGHQFGTFAGQLGDGRAVSIRECARCLAGVGADGVFAWGCGRGSGDAGRVGRRARVGGAAEGGGADAVLAIRGRAGGGAGVDPRVSLLGGCAAVSLSLTRR